MSRQQQEWPKFDPRLGLYLCQEYWNNQNWRHHCTGGFCDCPKPGCNGHTRPAEIKFTGKGQTSLLDLDLGEPLRIGKPE